MLKIFKKKEEKVNSPCSGYIKPLDESSDEVFSSKVLGEGFLIVPSDDKIIAPVSGRIVSLFPTNHAIGIESNKGVEVLIHIGIDTAYLEGKYFEVFVSQNQVVKKGEHLMNVDFQEIANEGYITDVYTIITNSDKNKVDYFKMNQSVEKNEKVLIVHS